MLMVMTPSRSSPAGSVAGPRLPGRAAARLTLFGWSTERRRARAPCGLLVLPPELLREALSRSAGARELVERTARERLVMMTLA